MITKIAFGSLLAFGLGFGALAVPGTSAATASQADCCTLGLACCETQEACCEKDKPACCEEGQACCDAVAACCSK
ncbi:hypothetical protein [Bremerella alba]|uniref:Uncharacterized protein n=1 Tax=Bremerella alba TaxID=980252 RepID=A0A7V8V623_9BACT|nr:hypothetical protein [Bremerella alba]MBA2115516.1 hypothetical protein [Bremerella alba]